MAIYAVDAGGTRIKLAVVEGGSILSRATLDACSSAGLAPRLSTIAQTLRDLLPSGAICTGIGIAFPSFVRGSRVKGDFGKYRDAEDIDLAAWAGGEFGVPLAIENDARLAAIGEWQYGAGRGCSDLVMITLGTGIGTGVILGGAVLRGRFGSAGILGSHMTGKLNGEQCPCGNVGCWETEASTVALPRLAMEEKGPEDEALDYANVFANADKGAGWAIRIRDRSLANWGALAVSLIHAYDPEILILGGGIMAAGDAVLGPIAETVKLRACSPWSAVKVAASALGDDAALLACEWLLIEKGVEI